MGEPLFPSIFGALANALYKATGKRVYREPSLGGKAVLGKKEYLNERHQTAQNLTFIHYTIMNNDRKEAWCPSNLAR